MNVNRYTIVSMIAMLVAAIAAFVDPTLAAAALLIAPAGAASVEELATELKNVASSFESKRSELAEMYGELKAKTEGNERIATSVKEAVDQALAKFNDLATDVKALEQKAAQRAKERPDEAKSYGQQFIESEAGQKVHSKARGVFATEVKAVTTTTAGTGLVRSRRENEITNLLRERLVIGDLLTNIPVAENSVDYIVQTTRTNAAATVAETAAKPYSDYAWTEATVSTKVIAHLAKMSRQALDDAPRLAGEIDSEMRYGLGYVKERQYLYGNNTGANLHGIVPQATAFSLTGLGYVPNALATRIDVLRLAILQVSIGLLPADAIVLNEIDWAMIELTKTTEGSYLMANPAGSVDARLWSLPVVVTPAMVAGDFLVGAFRAGATSYNRMSTEVLISTENTDDFEKNMATMRAEERLALAVKRPGAFRKGTFASILAPGAGMIPST